MILLLTVLTVLFFFVIVTFIRPILVRYGQLQKDYKSISFLPLSSIPFVGNLHVMDKQPHLFCQLLCRMSIECQKQGKGIFCLWYSIWPLIFFCEAKGIEVGTFYYYFSRYIFSLSNIDVH